MSETLVHLPKAALLTKRVRRYVGPLAAIFLGASLFVAAPAFAAQPPVGLGTADSFAVLAGSGITNTGATTITGDIGTYPTPSQTGFGSITLTGTNHAGDAVTQGAKDDLQTAYNDAFGRIPVTNQPVELGGLTLPPGVYMGGTFGITGTLTLNAMGDPNAEFIFKAGSTLISEVNSRVVLINGAGPCHVVWQVGSSATFKVATQFVGNVLAHTSITAQTGATFQGRLLALNGAVTMDTNTITRTSCVAPSSSGGGTTTPGTTTGGGTPGTTTSPGVTPGTTSGTGAPVPSSGPSSPTTPPWFATTPTPTGTSGGPPGRPATPFFTPLTPSTPSSPSTPSTPSTPSRPDLPVTGAQIMSILAIAVLLLSFGAVVVTAANRRRALQVS